MVPGQDERPHSTPRRETPGQTTARSRSGVWLLPPSELEEVRRHGDVRARRARVALYSHDTMGLGHMRRNLLVAQTLASSPLQPVVLVVAGAREAGTFAMPPGVDCVTLPALRKDAAGRYEPRCLDMPLPELIALRAKTIRAVLEGFEPDVLVVDNVPRGAVRELDPTLAYLRARGRTRCVLGLRDVLDEPAVVRWEWHRAANHDAIRDFFDAVWVYGDPAVYPLAEACQFPPEIAAKVRYTGYLDQGRRLRLAQAADTAAPDNLALPPGRLALCLVGGGQDGARLAEAFMHADLPPGTNGVLLTGPFMPTEARERLRRRAAAHPRVRVLPFVGEPAHLVRRADHVIAMGGYNTVAEVLSFRKRALIVPRVEPRREQLIRAERLRDLGLIEMLHPDRVHPRALAEWLAREAGAPRRTRGRVDLHGLERLPRYLHELLAASLEPSARIRREDRLSLP